MRTIENLERYHTVLFDWDGTLANSTPLWLDSIAASLAEFTPRKPEREFLLRAMGDWKMFADHGYFAPEDLLKYAARTHEIMAERRRETPLEDGADMALERLAKTGKRLGIVTAGERPHIEEMLDVHELGDAFEVVVSGTDVKRYKPDPEGIYVALGKLGITEADYGVVVMIGDNSRDLMAGHNAGIDSVLYLPQNAHFEYEAVMAHCADGYEPAAVIRSWHEFALPAAA